MSLLLSYAGRAGDIRGLSAGGADLGPAPRAEVPVVGLDRPVAGPAAALQERVLPGLLDLPVAPGAVAHEGHEALPRASRVGAAPGVAVIGARGPRGAVEARPVAPGAVAPFGREAALAALAVVLPIGHIAKGVVPRAAPGAIPHRLRDRSLAGVAAIV